MGNFTSRDMRTMVMQITPELAQDMLALNNNRRIRDAHVESLAEAMERGKWVLSPDGISFDRSGNLINGQHRLMAVIKSGCTVPMVVTLGCGDEAIGVIDQGKVRTKNDHMTMFCGDEPFMRSGMVISAVKYLLRRRAHSLSLSISNAEFAELMQLNRDALHTFYLIFGSGSSPGMCATDYGALLEAMLVTGDSEALKAYRDAYSLGKVDGGTNYNYNVVFSLKNRVTSAKMKHQPIQVNTLYNLVQAAFSAFRSARKVDNVRNTAEDCFKVDIQKFVNGGYNDAFVGMDAIYG